MKFGKYFKIFSFAFVVLLCYATPLYFSHKTLTEQFHEKGEAYFKGSGHLFQENLQLGLFVSVIDQIFWTAIISFILFLSLDKVVRTIAFKIIAGFLVIAFIIVVLIYGRRLTYYSTDFHSFCRSLDIITTWGSRILGLTISILIVNIGERQLRIKSTNR